MKRKIVLEDIYRLSYVSDAQISPDGETVAFVKTIPSKERNGYQSGIWLVSKDGEPYLLTDDYQNSTMPRWSPDGEGILFLSSKTGISQLYFYSLKDKTIEQLTFDKSNKSFPVWSPDGKKVAFISTIKADDEVQETIRHTSLKIKSGTGFIDFNVDKSIMILDIESKQLNRITPLGFQLNDPEYGAVFNPSWSSDSTRLVFAAKTQDRTIADRYPWKADIYVVDVKSGELKAIKQGFEYASKPIWVDDDQSIIFIGNRNEHNRASSHMLCKVNISNGAATYLSREFDRDIGDVTTSDFGLGYSEANPVLAKLKNKLYFIASDEGKANVFSLDLSTNQTTRVIGGDRRIYAYTLSTDERKIAFAYSAPDLPNDIAVFDLDSETEVRLTHVNREFLQEVKLAIPEQLSTETADEMVVHGWHMKPVDFEKGDSYPAVLNIHGGPALQWGWTFSFEKQILCAQGYGVIYCNPRGSRAYGQKYCAAILNDWGGLDFDDLMRFTDKALKSDDIDPNRLAVMGNSYGGFMTNWIISHTNRFKVAASMGCVSNFMTMFSSSDTGYFLDQLLGIDEVVDVHDLWELSPLAYAKDINTPVLFLNGTLDLRCPVDQAEQLYISLKMQAKDSEMVRFIGGDHTFHKTGKLSIRTARLNYILEYFGRYL